MKLALSIVCIVALHLWSGLAHAQAERILMKPEEIASVCELSEEVAEDGDAARTAQRRALTQSRFATWLNARDAPVVGWDEVTRNLEIRTGGRLPIGAGLGLELAGAPVVKFASDRELASDWALRYQMGKLRLKVTFVSAAWEDYEAPLCSEDDGGRHWLRGVVLGAELQDEAGRTQARFATALGTHVAAMWSQGVKGYLAAGTPVVTVPSVSAFPADSGALERHASDAIGLALREELYGCYLRGLARNSRLQGALVFRLAQDTEPQILVDSLHAQEVGNCAIERLRRVQDGRRQRATAIKATVIFRLEEGPGEPIR